MKLEEGIAKAGITNSQAGRILGKAPSTIGMRIKNGSELTVAELMLLEDASGKSLYRDFKADIKKEEEYDKASLPYLEGFGDIIKHPKIRERLNFDKELSDDIWFRHSNDLRIMTMQGNNMDAGEYPLANRDVLVIDTSIKTFDRAGMFVYTTNKLSYPAVAELKVNADGSLIIHHRNPIYSDEEYSPEDVKKMEFRIIGRMIKNMSLTK